MIWIFLILVLLHITCCIITFAGIKFKFLKVHKYMFFVVLFLPVWGFLSVLMLHFQIAIKKDGIKEVQMEKMKLNSEIYKSVMVDKNKVSHKIVPMEEALIINNPRERRELIMDVLNDNPREYIEFLKKAGDNRDTEVVHYAVTAMVEISKENDYKLQQFEKSYSENPDNYGILSEYCDFLWNCLEENLMQGQVEVMNRNLFDRLIKSKIQHTETLTDYVRYTKNCFKLQNYTDAGTAIKKIGELWNNSDEHILLKLQYFASLGRGDEIKKMLTEMEMNHTYISSKVKEAIAFWKN